MFTSRGSESPARTQQIAAQHGIVWAMQLEVACTKKCWPDDLNTIHHVRMWGISVLNTYRGQLAEVKVKGKEASRSVDGHVNKFYNIMSTLMWRHGAAHELTTAAAASASLEQQTWRYKSGVEMVSWVELNTSQIDLRRALFAVFLIYAFCAYIIVIS